MKQIIYYTALNGKCPFNEWFCSLDVKNQTQITKRINRLLDGHYGDYKKLKNSDLSELRFMTNKGYRIYFKELDNILILFLAGGDKSNQKNSIKKAEQYYKEFNERLYANE